MPVERECSAGTREIWMRAHSLLHSSYPPHCRLVGKKANLVKADAGDPDRQTLKLGCTIRFTNLNLRIRKDIGVERWRQKACPPLSFKAKQHFEINY
jgi:hypothetical protein